jgi:predicted DNA-binding transcriptional regulator YafY
MPRPADIGHLLLSLIPREPDRIDTTRLRSLLGQQGINRTPRAIQDKLHTLCADYPIRCIAKSKPYQWQWLKNAPSYEFPPMNAHTALTLKLAYDYLAALLPVSTLVHLKAQARRAEEVLARSSLVASWTSKVRVYPRGLNLERPEIDKAALAVVYDALLESRRFIASYLARGQKKARTFEVSPLSLVVRGSLLTLVCTIGKNPEPRQLHLHRMREARPTTRPARAPADFDVDAHIREGKLSFLLGPRMRLRLRLADFMGPTVEETPLSRDQRLKVELDGRLILEATVPDTLELRSWLASYGPHLEVLEPAGLRQQIGKDARAAASLYPVTEHPLPP